MKGINHDRLSIFVLCLLIPTFLYLHISIYELTQVFLFWIIGTLYLSPDLDARYSQSKLRIGPLDIYSFSQNIEVLCTIRFSGYLFVRYWDTLDIWVQDLEFQDQEWFILYLSMCFNWNSKLPLYLYFSRQEEESSHSGHQCLEFIIYDQIRPNVPQ